jgi:hypothetical protein
MRAMRVPLVVFPCSNEPADMGERKTPELRGSGVTSLLN